MLKSRKKMLLSSIAMLLVALVALGSATFAWYITQDTVTAKEAKFSASAAEGLEIRHHTDGTWTNSIDLDDKASLSPAAINLSAANDTFGSIFYAGNGVGKSYEDGDLEARKLDKLATTDTDFGNYFLIDDFDVASSDGEAKTVNWRLDTITAPAGTYMNFAVFKDGKLVAIFTSDDDPVTYKAAADTDTTKAIKGASYTPTVMTTGSNLNQTSFQVGTKTTPTHFDIVAYADGFNTECTSEKANISDVKVSFSFTTGTFS